MAVASEDRDLELQRLRSLESVDGNGTKVCRLQVRFPEQAISSTGNAPRTPRDLHKIPHYENRIIADLIHTISCRSKG